MHDTPTPAEILDAVAEALRADTLPLPFDRRVAAAALDIVRREIEQDPEIPSKAAERLSDLVGASGPAPDLTARLAELIRSGMFDERTTGLVDHLWQVTLAKVAVDQPDFALYRRLTAHGD